MKAEVCLTCRSVMNSTRFYHEVRVDGKTILRASYSECCDVVEALKNAYNQGLKDATV